MKAIKPRRGRPPKYGRPSQVVTVTLPADVLVRLSAIDADIGRAIVALVERDGPVRSRVARAAEVAVYGNHAVIVVTPTRALKRLEGVQLVPVGNGRALISLQDRNSIWRLELNIRDTMDRADVSPKEREALGLLADILRDARRSRGVAINERSIIVLESKRHRQHNGRNRTGTSMRVV
jgi:hypothetical protein